MKWNTIAPLAVLLAALLAACAQRAPAAAQEENTQTAAQPGITGEEALACARSIYPDAVVLENGAESPDGTDTVTFRSETVGTYFDRSADLTVRFRYDADAAQWEAEEILPSFDIQLHPVECACLAQVGEQAYLVEFANGMIHMLWYDYAAAAPQELTQPLETEPDTYGRTLTCQAGGLVCTIEQEQLQLDGAALTPLEDPYAIDWVARYFPGQVWAADTAAAEEAPALWKTVQVDRMWSPTHRVETYYRADGETLLTWTYDGVGDQEGVCTRDTYLYNEEGAMESHVIRSAGQPDRELVYTYEGGLLRQEEAYSGEARTGLTLYTYDINGIPSREIYEMGTEPLFGAGWMQYVYDDAGALAEQVYYDAQTQAVLGRVAYVYDEQGRIVRTNRTRSGRNDGWEVWNYDEAGLLQSVKAYNLYGNPLGETTYFYR